MLHEIEWCYSVQGGVKFVSFLYGKNAQWALYMTLNMKIELCCIQRILPHARLTGALPALKFLIKNEEHMYSHDNIYLLVSVSLR